MMIDAWERQINEKEGHYGKFLVYRDLGTRRSLLEAYQICEGKPAARKVTKYWQDLSDKQNWKVRAVLWDIRKQTNRDLDEVNECQQYSMFRRQLVKIFLPKVFQALDKVEPGTVKWSELNTSLRLMMDALKEDAEWAKQIELANAMPTGETTVEQEFRDDFAKKNLYTASQSDWRASAIVLENETKESQSQKHMVQEPMNADFLKEMIDSIMHGANQEERLQMQEKVDQSMRKPK